MEEKNGAKKMRDEDGEYDIVTGISGREYKIHRSKPIKQLMEEMDWSLKDKSAIETLRQKLMEDIKELKPITSVDDNSDYIDGFFMGYESAQAAVELIINKRFGVD